MVVVVTFECYFFCRFVCFNFFVFVSLFFLMKDSSTMHTKLALVVEDTKMEIFWFLYLFVHLFGDLSVFILF